MVLENADADRRGGDQGGRGRDQERQLSADREFRIAFLPAFGKNIDKIPLSAAKMLAQACRQEPNEPFRRGW